MARSKRDGKTKKTDPLAATLPPPRTITDHDVARRAYDLYVARECVHGHDLDDWLQAETELQARSSLA
ncbi:MAG: DUF2934 domain-containing protein [Acidobacteriota bacterium]